MFSNKNDLCWLSPSADAAHQDHREVQEDLKELLHDYALRSGWSPSPSESAQREKTPGLRYSLGAHDAPQRAHDECVARLLRAQYEKDETKWHTRRAMLGHCLVDVKRLCPARPAVQGGPGEDGSLLRHLQTRLRALGEPACDGLAHYPALQQGDGNDKGSVLLVREHLHAAVDLKIIFKAHEMRELQMPLYHRLQIMRDCAWALRALHTAGLGHGDLTLSCINVKLLTQQSKLDDYVLGYAPNHRPSTFSSAPEVGIAAAEGKALAPASVPPADIYAFGIICFELLSMNRVCRSFDGTKNDFRQRYATGGLSYTPPWHLLDQCKQLGAEGRKRFEDLIARCLAAQPERRPQIEEVCGLLDEAVLLTILPDPHQRRVWTTAVDMARKDAQCRAKGKVPQEPSDQLDGSTGDEPNVGGEEDDASFGEQLARPVEESNNIFRIQWRDLQRALRVVYLGGRRLPNRGQDVYYDETRLCLFVIHHLLAEWDMREILLLDPPQIEQLCRQWKLSRLFPNEDGNSFMNRFLRKDLLVKRALKGSVPLYNWVQFNQWFQVSSADAAAFVATISAIVFHEYFQLVESGREAKYLLHKSDLPAGTFFVHFSRSFAHRILFLRPVVDREQELSTTPFAVSWVEENVLKTGEAGSGTLVRTAYLSVEGGKVGFGSESYPSLEEWRDHMRSSGRARLSHPYTPPRSLEFMKLVWRTFKKRTRAERERSCCSWVGSPSSSSSSLSAPESAAVGDDVSSVINYLHPEVRQVVEDVESWIAQETPDAVVNTSSVPGKEGVVLMRQAESGGKWRTVFAKTMDGFLVLYEDVQHQQRPFDVITLEGTLVEAQGLDIIRLSSPLQDFINWEITVPEAEDGAEESRLTELRKWGAVMQFWAHRGLLHTAYSPVREQINCKWYVDGRDTFAAIYHAVLNAKHTVFITDWRLTGEVFLLRQAPYEDCHRVDQLLKKKAEQGVEIYILLWRDPALFSDNGSREVQKLLTQLHDNIKIMRHPYFKHIPNSSYTHHQKSVVVDYGSKDIVAFVGGLDLTWGRWDTSDHSITDYNRLAEFWPGKDYWNQEEPSFKDPFVDILDRDHDPRMAWHDVHMSVDGEAALDVAYNFVHRWNHHLAQLPDARQEGLPVLEPRRNPFRSEVEVDPNVQYRLYSMSSSARTRVQERRTEVEAAARVMNRPTQQDNIVQKLLVAQSPAPGASRHHHHHHLHKTKLRRIRGRIVRVAVRFVSVVKKAAALPLRGFRTKAKAEERREKERVKRSRVDLMASSGPAAAVGVATHEEEEHKSAQHERRSEQISEHKDPSEAARELEATVERERSEGKGATPASTASAAVPQELVGGGGAVAAHEEEEGARELEVANDHKEMEEKQKEKSKWHLLREKFTARHESESFRAQDLWGVALSKALPTRLHEALHRTPPLPYPQTCAEAVKCRCQLLRSMGKWSGGNRLEQSIQEAQVSMIQRAKHFIYIENQYFISTVDNHGPCNQIAAALVARLARAIRQRERFMVTLVIPITPSMASAEDLKTRIITKLQYKTIWEGKRSIYEALRKQLGVGDEEIQRYFRVNALRNHGSILGCPVTNQVYVHAKMIIIDDCEAIIGSANINDRSMEGDRDSELAVWVEDTDTLDGRMAGQDFRVGKYVHSLRMNLWREHLGLQEDVKAVELKDERHRVVGSSHVHPEKNESETDNEKKRRKKEKKQKKRDQGKRKSEEERIQRDKEERERQEAVLMKRKTDEEERERVEAENMAQLVAIICDPMSDESVQLWNRVSEFNTRIYEEVFPYVPQNAIATLEEFYARKRAFEAEQRTWNQQKRESIREKLKQIRGHLVNYPLKYLVAEKMLPNPVSDPVLSVMKQAFW